MTKEERDNRHVALNEAARHRTVNEKAFNVVENAEKYFKFLQGDKEQNGA